MERSVPVVQVQAEILEVFPAEGQPPRCRGACDRPVLVHFQPEGGVLLDVESRDEESQHVLGVLELEIDFIRGPVP